MRRNTSLADAGDLNVSFVLECIIVSSVHTCKWICACAYECACASVHVHMHVFMVQKSHLDVIECKVGSQRKRDGNPRLGHRLPHSELANMHLQTTCHVHRSYTPIFTAVASATWTVKRRNCSFDIALRSVFFALMSFMSAVPDSTAWSNSALNSASLQQKAFARVMPRTIF